MSRPFTLEAKSDAIFNLLGYTEAMNFQQGLVQLGYDFVPFLLAVVGHEFGHGLMAHWWGDDSAKESGRLTLNPAPHIDPIGTLLLPILGMVTGTQLLFGWARPVPIDPRRFKKFRPGLFFVSLAGPLANAVMALFCAIGFCLLIRFATPEFLAYKELKTMLGRGILINFGLGVFNLIPLPPLDGSKIIESMLSYPAMQKYEALGQYSFIILIILITTNILSFLSTPIMVLSDWTLVLANLLTGSPL